MSEDKKTSKDVVDETQTSQEHEVSKEDEVTEAPAPEVSEENTEKDEAPEEEKISAEDPLTESKADDAAETDAEEVEGVEVEEPAEESADTQTPVEEPVVPPAPVEKVVVKKSGFVPMLLGGVLCVGFGYAAAQFIKPAGWPFPGSNTDELSTQIAALEAQFADLKSSSAAQEQSQAAALETLRSDLESQLSEADDGADEVAALQSQLEAFDSRLTATEARPVADAVLSPEATEAFQSQIDEMQSLLNAEITRLQEAKAQSLAEEAAAREATLKARLQTRVNAGEPFDTVLAELGDVPAELESVAASGIPSTSALQEAYSASARQALISASKAAHDAGEQGWFATVLQTQLGLRSTEPKEGDDADAILSRAEQAVREGSFAKAIETLGALPEAGQQDMQGWIAQAQQRVDVMSALDAYLAQ